MAKTKTTAKRSVELFVTCPICSHDFQHLPFLELDKISKDNPEIVTCKKCGIEIHVVKIEL